jgi:hypothetical protein
MAVLDAKLPVWQATKKAISPTKAEALALEGKVPLVIDGGGLGSGVRVLLKNQVKTEQNGLFEVTTNEAFGGTGTFGSTGEFGKGSSWTLTRTPDADSSGEVTEGMLVLIEDGETNQATSWIQRTAGPIEVGVTAQTFEPLVAGARGNAGGELEGLYSKPSIAEAVIDNNNVKAEAAISGSKLDLKASVDASDLATSAKELSPQLPSPLPAKQNFGQVTVELGAAETTTAYAKVAHGLGVVPKSVTAVSNTEEGAIGGIFAECKELSKETFSVRACRPFGAPGKATKITIGWQAFG